MNTIFFKLHINIGKKWKKIISIELNNTIELNKSFIFD